MIFVNQSDCESKASSDIPNTSQLIAILITTVCVLCAMSCVIGALFHWIIASHAHCGCLKSKKKSTVSGNQPHHIYDEVDLSTAAALGTEVDASQHSNRDMPTRGGLDSNIVTTKNKAYQKVRLSRSRHIV